MYVCMYVCMCVCVYVCVCVFMYAYMPANVHVYIHACMYVVCMYVCIDPRILSQFESAGPFPLSWSFISHSLVPSATFRPLGIAGENGSRNSPSRSISDNGCASFASRLGPGPLTGVTRL